MNATLRFSGLRTLVADLTESGRRPFCILLSDFEKRDLKQELLEACPITLTGDHGTRNATDTETLCFIDGVPVMSSADVPRGKAWVIPADKQKVVM